MRLIVARCEVRYTGRLSAFLPESTRLVMIKADGSVLVHADAGGYKPLNSNLTRKHLALSALMGAEVDALCGACYGERSPERVNRRNGYRERDWDTRVGSIELAVPKLREGSYFPDWLLQPRRRAEQAFVSVIADAYLAGVSTRRVEKLVQQLGVERMSKSQVSRLAKSLDQIVEGFRTRPLDGAPYAYLVLDALEVKCREGGRTVNVCVVHAVAVNRDGFRESLGLDVVTDEKVKRSAALRCRFPGNGLVAADARRG